MNRQSPASQKETDQCHPDVAAYIRSYGSGNPSLVAALSQHPEIVKDLRKSKLDISIPEVAASIEEDQAIIPCTNVSLIVLATGWKNTQQTRQLIRESGPWALYVFWGIFEDDCDTIKMVRLRPSKPICWKNSPENRRRVAEGKKPKSQKYLTRKGDTNYPFYPRSAPRIPKKACLGGTIRPAMNCIWTEGEKKALAAWYFTGIPTLGAVGVYGHRTKDNEAQSKYAEARRQGYSTIHPEDRGECAPFVCQIDWEKVNPVIIYDSDLATNVKVQSALKDLSGRLYLQGCPLVKQAFLSANPAAPQDKVGIDDLLNLPGGEEQLMGLFQSAQAIRNPEEFDPRSGQSRNRWEVNRATHGGRFGACKHCRRSDQDYACETCGKDMGVGRPYSGSRHCPKSKHRLLEDHDHPNQGAVMVTSCRGWHCQVCGYRQEYDHRCHYRFWACDLHQGIIHVPTSRHPANLKSRRFRVGAIYHFAGIPFEEYQVTRASGAVTTTNTKSNFSAFLSKLKKKYGGLHISLFTDSQTETFDYYLFVPQGVEIPHRELQWRCRAGPSKGLKVIAAAVTSHQFENHFLLLLPEYGRSISLERTPLWDDIDKPGKRHCPIGYCEPLTMPKRSISSGKYGLVGSSSLSLDQLLHEIRERGGKVQPVDITKIDLSHERGLNRSVWHFSRFSFPSGLTVEQFLAELRGRPLVEPVLNSKPIGRLGPLSKRLHIQNCLYT